MLPHVAGIDIFCQSIQGQWKAASKYLDDKVTAAEVRDKKRYGGLRTRYKEIIDCLKDGDFSPTFYRTRKLPRFYPEILPPPLLPLNRRQPNRIPAGFPQPPLASPVGSTSPAVVSGITPRIGLLTIEELRFFNDTRNRLLELSENTGGFLGESIENIALKMNSKSVVQASLNAIRTGIDNFLDPRNTIESLSKFTEYGAHLMEHLSNNALNVSGIVGLSSSNLIFNNDKLDELAQPFLLASAYYQGMVGELQNINRLLEDIAIDPSKSLRDISSILRDTRVNLLGHFSLLDSHHKEMEELFDDDSTAKQWASVCHDASVNMISAIPLSFKHPGLEEKAVQHNALTSENDKWKKAISTAGYSVQFFSGVMQLIGKPEIAEAVTAVAVPALNLATTFATFSTIAEMSGPAAPYVAVAGGVVMLALGVVSLFKGKPTAPTSDEIILRQFERLSIQIDQQFKRQEKLIMALVDHVDMQFEEVRNTIIKGCETILTAVSNLHQDVNQGLQVLITRVEEVQHTLHLIATRNEALFTEVYTREFKELIFSHQIMQEQVGQGIDPNHPTAKQEYLSYYRLFRGLILNDATSEVLAGERELPANQEASRLVTLLQQAFNPTSSLGYESKINAIVAFAHTYDPEIPRTLLANPYIWSKAAHALIKFVTYNTAFSYGDNVKDKNAKQIQYIELMQFMQKGTELLTFFSACRTSGIFWERLVGEYQRALKNVVIEMYRAQWPASPEALDQTIDENLQHIVALRKLDIALDDYIAGRAGPPEEKNLFHTRNPLARSLTDQFPNPGYHFLPGFLVHCLRASKVRFHNAASMRKTGKTMLRPYLGVPVAEERSNAACEDAIRRYHPDLGDGIDDVRSDGNTSEPFDYPEAKQTKKNVADHQDSWLAIMENLRRLPTQMQQGLDFTRRHEYADGLLKKVVGREVRVVAEGKDMLPRRDLMKQAYDKFGTSHQSIRSFSSNPALESLRISVNHLDEQAYLLQFFIKLLFPHHVHIHIAAQRILWSHNRIAAALQGDMPLQCDLILMPSAPTLTTPFRGANSAYVLVQSTAGSVPTTLYFVDRSNTSPVISQIVFPSGQSVLTFIATLYPGATNHSYSDILNLSSTQLQQITSITGYTLPLTSMLHNLLEREHPRLPTSLEACKTLLLEAVQEATEAFSLEWASLVFPNIYTIHNALLLFQSQYFSKFLKPISKAAGITAKKEDILEDSKIIPVPKDGHCFFKSIELQLEDNGLKKKNVSQLRREAVQFMREHPLEGFPYGSFSTFESYCSAMENDAWAEGNIIEATALMLGVHLIILNYHGETKFPNIMHINEKENIPILILKRTDMEANQHYDAVINTKNSKKTNPNQRLSPGVGGPHFFSPSTLEQELNRLKTTIREGLSSQNLQEVARIAAIVVSAIRRKREDDMRNDKSIPPKLLSLIESHLKKHPALAKAIYDNPTAGKDMEERLYQETALGARMPEKKRAPIS